MPSLRIGLVALARTTFDIPLATKVTGQFRAQLQAAGLALEGPAGLVTDLAGTQAAAQALAAQPPDLLLVFQATFADSTMAVALAEAVEAPLLLWAVPEAPTGGRLRLNSLCGINLAGHALTLRRRRYDYVYAAPGDALGLAKVRALAAAGRVYRSLRGARLGVVGDHPAGFDSCRLDPARLQSVFGIEACSFDLASVFARARAARPAQVGAVRAALDRRLDNLAALDQAALNGTLSVYLALKQMAAQERLAALAVRCWPEFFTELGCAACGAMSMLTDEQTPCSCEADVNGTVTQMILQGLSGQPAFGTDLVSMDFAANTVVLWHCGLAPLSMADPAVKPHGTVHSNRRLPLLMEFTLKPGVVTVARLTQSAGEWRLVVGRGEMLSAPASFTGTSGVLRFERPAQAVFDTILGEGLEHHVSLTYGDHLPALLALARMLNLPVLPL